MAFTAFMVYKRLVIVLFQQMLDRDDGSDEINLAVGKQQNS